MNGSVLGHHLASLSDISYKPFYVGYPLSQIGEETSALSVFTFPLRVSAMYNLARMTFRGGQSIGLFSNITRPFHWRRPGWSYKSKTFTGLLGDVIADLSPRELLTRVKGKILTEEVRKARYNEIISGVSGVRRPAAPKYTSAFAAYRKQWGAGIIADDFLPLWEGIPYVEYGRSAGRYAVYTPSKTVASDVVLDIDTIFDDFPSTRKYRYSRQRYEQRMSLAGSYVDEAGKVHPIRLKPTLLQRWYIYPSKLEEIISSVDPNIISKAGGMEKILDEYLRGMYAFDKEYYTIAGRIKRIGERLASIPKRFTEAISRRSLAPIFSYAETANEAIAAYVQAQKRFTVNLMDLLLGRGEDTYFKNIAKHFDDIFWGRKRFSFAFRHSRNRARAELYFRTQKELAGIIERSVTLDAAKSQALRDALSFHSISADVRLRLARMAKVGLFATLGIEVGFAAGSWAYKTTTSFAARASSTLAQLRRMEFGSNIVLENASLATERQRAIEAIANAQLNARYLLGSEAQLYH